MDIINKILQLSDTFDDNPDVKNLIRSKKFEDGGRVPYRVGGVVKKTAMGAITPSGVATILTPDLDLTKAENRISLAAEAAFAEASLASSAFI